MAQIAASAVEPVVERAVRRFRDDSGGRLRRAANPSRGFRRYFSYYVRQYTRMTRRRITYWEKWGGAELAAMAAIAHAFNATQEEYEVQLSAYGDWSASPDLGKLLAAIELGTPPDLIGLEDKQFADLAGANALMPLDELVCPRRDLCTYHERCLNLGRAFDTLYGVPACADLITLYLNLNAVAGTSLEREVPTQLAQFDRALGELAARGRRGLIPSYPGWWPELWPWLFGGGWLYAHGRFVPDTAANVEAFTWVASLRQRFSDERFAAPVNPLDAGPRDPFFLDEVGLVIEGDWLIQRLKRKAKLKWRVAPLPSLTGEPVALLEADLVAIPRGAPNPAGGAAFLRFLAQPAQIERLALAHGKISPLAEWSDGYYAAHPNPELRPLRHILDSARLHSAPRVPGWLNYLERIKSAFAQVWSGAAAPDAALKAIRVE